MFGFFGGSGANAQEQQEAIELAKITVYDKDGKEFKTYMVDAESIDWEDQSVNFLTREGKQVTLLTGNNLVEIGYP